MPKKQFNILMFLIGLYILAAITSFILMNVFALLVAATAVFGSSILLASFQAPSGKESRPSGHSCLSGSAPIGENRSLE